MRQHDDPTSLRQMREAAREALALIEGLSRADLDENRVLALALERLLEIVGEAANRLSPSLRSRHVHVKWKGPIGHRNQLAHGYDSVDRDLVWSILTTDLPQLERDVTAVLAAEGIED